MNVIQSSVLCGVFGIIAIVFCSGCGLKIGPEKDPWLTLPQGFGVQFGVNNIDHVIDRRGVNVSQHAERY